MHSTNNLLCRYDSPRGGSTYSKAGKLYSASEPDILPLMFDKTVVRFRLVNVPKPQQLNCFMNSVLQALWNIEPYR